MEKLFEYMESEGKTKLSDDFKSKVEDIFNVALADKAVEINTLTQQLNEKDEEIAGLTEQVEKMKQFIEEEVDKTVEEYKEGLVEKIDSFLEAELSELVPDSLIEAQAKIEIYEPLVEGFKQVISKHGVQIDSEGHELLKDAKTEIENLAEEVNEKTAEYNELEEAAEKLLARVLIMEKSDGMTDDQKEKIAVLFDGKSSDEINEKFDEIATLIITEQASVEDTKGNGSSLVTEKVEMVTTKVDDNDLGQKYIH